jgi:hypothetical protein
MQAAVDAVADSCAALAGGRVADDCTGDEGSRATASINEGLAPEA